MQKIESLKDLKENKKNHDFMLVVFYTPGSQKSLDTKDTLQKLEEEKEAAICSVDVSNVRDIHTEYNITSVPTVLVFRQGSPAELIKGKQTLTFYEKLFRKIEIEDSEDESSASHDVTVYTTPTCQYCSAVKQYLDQKNVMYQEVDVSQDQSAAQELMNQTGQRGVPQIDIDGNFVVGYNTKEIDNLLNL
ncbi:MAG TPA: glutaredoxin domain-containing protein [bacterium]|nr:glutaredoxin domain-containing protein [bacterium]